MKLPKVTRRYCPFCNKQTEQKIKQLSSGTKRGSLKRGSIVRARLRGQGRGIGNKGKWGSKPANAKHNRKTKTTKKSNLLFTCTVCSKSKGQKYGRRVSKVVIQ